jgi:acyl dehydratase
MPEYYFEDFPVGRTFATEPWPLSEEDILAYARKYDPQPYHTDPEAAARMPFGGLIASGFHTVAIASGQLVRAIIAHAAGMGGPGMDDIRWLKPVRPGDVLRTTVTVQAARVSNSKPDRGFVTFALETTNDAGTVLTLTATVIVALRAPATTG